MFFFVIAVNIPPSADANAALSILLKTIGKLQSAHPDGILIVAGDFNHVNMRTVLPNFYQHVTSPPRPVRPPLPFSLSGLQTCCQNICACSENHKILASWCHFTSAGLLWAYRLDTLFTTGSWRSHIHCFTLHLQKDFCIDNVTLRSRPDVIKTTNYGWTEMLSCCWGTGDSLPFW